MLPPRRRDNRPRQVAAQHPPVGTSVAYGKDGRLLMKRTLRIGRKPEPRLRSLKGLARSC